MLAGDSAQFKRNVEKLKNIKAGIKAGPDIVTSEGFNYFSRMQAWSAQAYRDTKDYIKNQAVTPTGLQRGNPKGRYETGEMYRAFKGTPGGGRTSSQPRGRGVKLKFFFEMGWLDRMPGYTLFQEYGTKNGIKAMDALGYAEYALQANVIDSHYRNKDEFLKAVANGFEGALKTGKWKPSVRRPSANWWAKNAMNPEE